MRSERHKRGAVSEAVVSSEFMKMGFTVSTPMEEARYDIIVDVGGELLKVQVKRCWECNDRESSYAAEFRSQSVNTNGVTKKTYSNSEVDGFAIHNPNFDEVYWLWVDEAPDNTRRKLSSWRLNDIHNHFKKNKTGSESDIQEKKDNIEGSIMDY